MMFFKKPYVTELKPISVSYANLYAKDHTRYIIPTPCYRLLDLNPQSTVSVQSSPTSLQGNKNNYYCFHSSGGLIAL